jgi:hypothetical protein
MDLATWTNAFDAFVAEPGPWKYLVSWVRASRCLPVYCDWTHAIGVTEHGMVIVFEHDPSPASSGPPDGELTDVRLVNVALHQGAKRYAWLKALLPPRPIDAQQCSMCGGTGEHPMNGLGDVTRLICYCGGAGWVPATDTWVNEKRLRSAP